MQFASRRATQATLKSSDSIKRFSYLLGQTDLFRHFCDLKAERDPEFRRMLEESEKALVKGKESTKKGKEATSRGRKSEKDEDRELQDAENAEEADGPFVFTESPACAPGSLDPLDARS